MLFHYFERFLEEYEHRFQKEYGYLRPIVQEVVEKYLDCGNPKNGFARIKCKDCGLERLLMFSCKTRGVWRTDVLFLILCALTSEFSYNKYIQIVQRDKIGKK